MSSATRRAHRATQSTADAATVRPPAARAPHAALLRAARTLARSHLPRPSVFDGAEHWPRDAAPSGPAESRERLAHTGEQQVWLDRDAAQEVAQRALTREVAVYARALHHDGVELRRAIVVVTAVVREVAAALLGSDALGTLVHGAGRDCVMAYYLET
jgi:hypothetical protein